MPIKTQIAILLNRFPHDVFEVLEECITDDSSASVNVCELHRLGTTPRGDVVLAVRIDYDGFKYLDVATERIQQLREVELPAAELAFMRGFKPAKPNSDLLPAGDRRRRRRPMATEPPRPAPINWLEAEVWTNPDGTAVPIKELDDASLWHTVGWCVHHAAALYGPSQVEHIPLALQACRWLASRPLFRALLREAILRDFTFSRDIYRFIKDYVLDKKGTLDGYQPWRDPALSEQPKSLKAFLAEPVTPPELDMGKPLRVFDL